MDPVVCIQSIIDAAKDEDWLDFAAGCENMYSWCRQCGHVPLPKVRELGECLTQICKYYDWGEYFGRVCDLYDWIYRAESRQIVNVDLSMELAQIFLALAYCKRH